MELDDFASALLQASPDGMLVVDAAGKVQLANRSAALVFGYDDESRLVGRPVEDLVPEEQRRAHAKHRQRYLEAPERRPMGTGLQLFGQHATGDLFPVEISLSPVELDGECFTIATVRDVTDREESAANLAMLRDRERIARDLHDMVIQRIFAAGMNLQAVLGEVDSPMVAERIRQSVDELDHTIAELRSTIFRLGHNEAARSVSALLVAVAHDRRRVLGFEPVVRVRGAIDDVPDHVAEQLLATVSEGLANVGRHAGATAAEVVVEELDGRIRLEITDNGVGLTKRRKQGGGIRNRMWRAAELGGSCSIAAAEPSGTRLVWEVPT
jgi:PAS domain S-box-containing protein